jgi:hypothetical protein
VLGTKSLRLREGLSHCVQKSDKPFMKVTIEVTLKGIFDRVIDLELKEGETKSFGRQGGAFELKESKSVSRSHGSFSIKDHKLHFQDHSSQGSFRNGERIESLDLSEGEIVEIGEYFLEIKKIENQTASKATRPLVTSAKKKPVATEVPVQSEGAIRHAYSVKVRDAGFFRAMSLFTQTLSFSLARFAAESAITIVSIVWFFMTLGVAALSAKIHPNLSIVVFIVMGGFFAGAWRGFIRYFFQLLKAAHVVVLTDLIVHGEVKNGNDSMLVYGKKVVRDRFGEVNSLLVMGQIVKGVVNSFNRTINSMLSFIPGSQDYLESLYKILNWATTYIDEAIFSYGLARAEKNPWKNSREGLIYYCQNAKAFLVKAVFMTIWEWFLTGVASVLCFVPLFALLSLLPQNHFDSIKLVAVCAAFLVANSIKSCFIKPVMMIMLLSKFHTAIEGQPIDEEWDARLTQLSNNFVDIKNRANDWLVANTDRPAGQVSRPAA